MKLPRSFIPRFILFFIAASPFLALTQTSTRDFEIASKGNKIEGSLYNRFSIIDSRIDTTNMGFIQGGINEFILVQPSESIASQILRYCESTINNENSADQELFIQLRKWQFSEMIIGNKEVGACLIRISFYLKEGGLFYPIATMNKKVLVESIEATRLLTNGAKEEFENYTRSILKKESERTVSYTLAEVQNIDEIEKREIPIYSDAQWTDGLYRNYNSFKSQKPDSQVEAVANDSTLLRVRYMSDKGKFESLRTKNQYAVVYQGIPYIYTKYGYYKLEKTDEHYQFIGRMEISPERDEILITHLMFGLIGGATLRNDALFSIRIDHFDGRFVKLRAVEEPKN